MNDSTSENPDATSDSETANMAPEGKKPAAAKRAPRKKAFNDDGFAGVEVNVATPSVQSQSAVDAAMAPSPVTVSASLDAGRLTDETSPLDAEPGSIQNERRDSGGRRGPPPRADGPGRDRHRGHAPVVEGYQFQDVVSGKFDEDDGAAESFPSKRVLLPQVETPKLHKVLAQAGLGSRLEMEQLILEGRISVNNEPAHIGQRIQFGDQVKVNGKPIRYRIEPPPARVIAYHKPVGEVVTHDDPQNRPTVFRKLPRLTQGKWQSVGRLDLNTEGLLLFTSSGELANKLMHPRFGLEREYAVRVLGALSNEEKKKLLDGVRLDDGMASFGSIEDGGGEGANCWYRVTISEGRNREVRRMLESVGHAVSRLIRIRYGAMMLPRGLKRGAWLELDESDIRALVQAAGAGRAEPQEGRADVVPGSGGQTGNSRNRGRSGPRVGDGPRGNLSQGGPAVGGRGQRPRRDAEGSPAQRVRGNNAGGGDRLPGGAQPDPLKTSVGYIGVDSLSRHRQDKRRPSGGGSRRVGR